MSQHLPSASLETRRILAGALLLCIVVVALLFQAGSQNLLPVSELLAADRQRLLVVFEDPSADLLEQMHADPDIDVRWVETGLVVAEISPARQSRWGGRVLARRSAEQMLAILRAADRASLKASDVDAFAALEFVTNQTVGTATAQAGVVTLLLSEPGTWPDELLGCHGGLVLAPHAVDPRTLLDRGPPAALAPWVYRGVRPWSAAQRQALQSVSTDSLQIYWDDLRRNSSGLPADRWAFSQELSDVYIPLVQTRMQQLLQGVAGATVELQAFEMQRDAPGSPPPADSTISITTQNVIARIPGSVPGTGTFVIGAHLDATGSRNALWRNAVGTGIPIETPGAEDNATGVACVLEMLRNVADGVRADSLSFAFDLEFIAFSGEEVGGNEAGLKGSMHYVNERRNAGTTLLGIFNMDMVGSDSLGNNLQVVHNRASTWMVDFVIEAMNQVVPPLDLTLTPEIDEALSSDHNSFWIVGSDGLLGADASVNILRRYASYHRPSDTGADVSVAKMGEVTRAFLAALLRFDTMANPDPELLFPPEKLRLLIEVQGQEFTYDRNSPFHALNPGDTKLKAQMTFYNLGASYSDSLQVQMETRAGNNVVTSLLDSMQVALLPTGGRIDIRLDPVPLDFGGAHTLVARLRSLDTSGSWVSQTASLDYVVEGAGPPGQTVQQLRISNPETQLSDSKVFATTGEGGTLRVRVYNLEGELIATREAFFTPSEMSAGVKVLDPNQPRPGVVSGTYLVDLRWTGLSGSLFSEVLPAGVVH